MAEKAHNTELVIPDAPIGTPNDLTEYFKLMFDLMALAFQADITRVITLSMDHEASMRTYTNLASQKGSIRCPIMATTRRRWTSW